MSTLLIQAAVFRSTARGRHDLLNRQHGKAVNAISSQVVTLTPGESVSGSAEKTLIVSSSDAFNKITIVLSKDEESITFSNVTGLMVIPAGVAYAITYPEVTGATPLTLTIISA